MRILYVLEHYHPYIGGAEKLFQNVAESMARQGHEVTVITTKHHRSLPAKTVHNGVKIIRVRCFNRYLFTFFALWRLMRLSPSFDLVHATTYNAAFPAWLFSKIKNIPSVLTFHEVWAELWYDLPFMNPLERWGFYWYEQLVLKLKFDHYIAVSKATEQALIKQGIPKSKIVQIYNGLDPEDYDLPDTPETTRDTDFVFFGRLGVSKGLDLLIPALAILKPQYPGLKLKLIIPKRPKNILREVLGLINRCNVIPMVEILHELPFPQLLKEITSSKAVVVPSYTEGFCFVAAEACALRMPVVHSGRMALEEVVSGRQIVFDHMTPESLAEALENAILGKWKEGEYRAFTLSNSISNYMAFYESMV